MKIKRMVLAGLLITMVGLMVSGCAMANKLGLGTKNTDLVSVPNYPDATLTSKADKTKEIDAIQLYLTFDYQTSDDSATVADWYKKNMATNGWSLMENGPIYKSTDTELYFDRSDNYNTATIKLTSQNGATKIDLIYQGDKEGAFTD